MTKENIKKLKEKKELYEFLQKENKFILKLVKKTKFTEEDKKKFNKTYKEFLKELKNLETEIFEGLNENYIKTIEKSIKDFEE